ncbi:MAG: LptE family protein [Bryobacteraceae bacterium]|jgi:hypothetical protein
MSRLNTVATVLLAAAGAAIQPGCGYHVSGQADMMPKTVKTIAIPAFPNATMRYKLAALLPEDLTREFHSRTSYVIVPDASQADAVLAGTLIGFSAYPTVSDPQSGRATAVQVEVTVDLTLTERRTGAVLFSNKGAKFRERYEVALDPKDYFDESGTAIERVSRDVARDVVSAILEKF